MRVIRWSCRECGRRGLIELGRPHKISTILRKIREGHHRKNYPARCNTLVGGIYVGIPGKLTVQEVHDILVKDGILAK